MRACTNKQSCWLFKKIAFSFLSLSFSFFTLTSLNAAQSNPNSINCSVVIVGGGAAGVHSLFRLAPYLHSDVCLFEKNDYFGGRVKDVPSPNGKGVFATGAMRVQETQNLVLNLAKELGITLEQESYGNNRVFARNTAYEDVNDFLLSNQINLLAGMQKPVTNPLYTTPAPSITFPDPVTGYPPVGTAYPDQSTAWNCDGDNNYNGCFNDAYYHALLNPAYKPAPMQYADNRTWLQHVLQPEGFQYLTDTFRFRGDFENGVDPISYRDFLTEDWDVCCSPYYPVGGMSAFTNGMVAKATANGARTFLSEAIISIDKDSNSGKFVLKTAKNNTVYADSVIVAVPPVGFNQIGGAIANKIKADPHYQAIIPVRVVSIDQWWKTSGNTSPWWMQTAAADGSGHIDRAWATKDGYPTNPTLCFNFVEFAHSPYQAAQLGSRSVYNDDTACSEFWTNLLNTKGIQGVNDELVREFKLVFPEVANKISTKDITKTYFQDWPDAWYWLKGPTTLTNADIAVWALNPIPGSNISLASDAYNPNRTTWTDGAYKSSINTLNYNYANMTATTGGVHNARIKPILPAPLACSSIAVTNGQAMYVPFNKDGVFNANCPLQ